MMMMNLSRPSVTPGKILVLALVYVAAGHLSLLLAVPPGFASAIFPPVGIALASVLLWGYGMVGGVFLGSLILNIYTGLAADGGALNHGIMLVATGIALGTSAQTILGAGLIRRFVRLPTVLTDERDIFRFLLLGGPVACLASATIGTSALYLSQTIPAAEYLYSWWIWWVGDTMGVLIAAPLTLIFFAAPRALWRKRMVTVGVPLALSCAIMVVVYILSSNAEQQRVQLKFHEQSNLVVAALKSRFESCERELKSVERFYAASGSVRRKEFGAFVAGALSSYPEIQALDWLPVVRRDQRAVYEQRLQGEGFPGFRITELSPDKVLVPARERDEYVPITYAEPVTGNLQTLGYDLGSRGEHRAALNRARDSGRAVMSGLLDPAQVQRGVPAVLIYYPIYATQTPPTSVPERRRLLRGYALGVIRLDDMVDAAMDASLRGNYALQILDYADPDAPILLYGAENRRVPRFAQPLAWGENWLVSGRSVRFQVSPTDHYLRASRDLQSWSVLAGGLLVCSLLGAFLLTTSGHADKIQHLVERRTLELRSILDNAVEAIVTFNEHGLIESANPAAATLFGYAAGEIPGMHMSALVPRLCRAAGEKDAISCANLHEVVGKSREMLGMRKDGVPLAIEIGVSRVDLPERQLYTGMIHDVSERKKMDRLKSEFVATVSHELRTPVTSISGSLGLLASGATGELTGKARELVGIAKNNAERLVKLVNDILDIEKLEFGRIEFALRKHDLRALLQQAVMQNSGYADTFGVRLRLNDAPLEQSPALVLVDPYRFSQVMSNLISNAVKFSDPGGQVDVDVERAVDAVKVLVHDRGPGIPDYFRASVFEKFAQADGSDSRRRGGTGLGLNITKTIIEKMNGSIGYTSDVGRGTTFFFTLPAYAADGR